MVPHRVHRWATESQPIYLSADHVQYLILWCPQVFRKEKTHSRSVSKSMIKPDQTPCQEVSGTYVLQGIGYHLYQESLHTEPGTRDRDSRVDLEKYTQEYTATPAVTPGSHARSRNRKIYKDTHSCT